MTTQELRQAQRRGVVALAGRETRRVFSLWTQTILPPLVTATLLLAVFGGALAGRIGEIEGVGYRRFILPGLVIMTIASQATANASTSLFQAKNEGYLEDILSSPLRAWHVVSAYMIGALARALTVAIVITLVAVPFVGGFSNLFLVLLTLGLTGLVFSALGTIVGVFAETFDQHSFVSAVLVTPLALVAGVFYSASTLAEPWQTLTKLDPIYYLVDATRAGFTGFHESHVWLSLSVASAVAMALFATAAALVGRGWRLKP